MILTKRKYLKKLTLLNVFCYSAVFVFSLLCILPFALSISGSLSLEEDIIKHGYSLIPRHVSFLPYQILFMDMGRIARAYKITLIVTVVGTVLGLLINTMMGYSISRKNLRYRNFLSFYIWIPILFSGGMVPWYIVCVNLLHLKNMVPALIIPYLANSWNIFLMRNFIRSIPDEMHESAKIDGASEMTIFLRIILPLSKPALATVGLFTALGYWNDWWLGLMLIDKIELQPLQMLLRILVSNVDFIRSSANSGEMAKLYTTMPGEGLKMAMGIITVGPIIFLYPFLQRYFIKGIMIGAVKG